MTTTTTTTAATAAVATAATAAVATTTATPGFARPGLVDRESAAINLLIVESLNGRLGLGITAHLHEAEAFATARIAVLNHLALCTLPNSENNCSRSASPTW